MSRTVNFVSSQNRFASPALNPDMRTLLFICLISPVLTFAGTVKFDISYGDDPLQKLDVYLPDQPVKAPVMVYIHGGGWMKGDKKAVGENPAFFNGKGWIFVSINYRLLPEGRHPENVNDVALAIAKIHDRAPEEGGDPEKIFVMGHSAGAHLAALVATDPRPLVKAGKSLGILKGTIALDTNAYDIPRLIAELPAELYTEVFGSDAAEQKDASPQFHVAVDKGISPFLICYSAGMGRRPQATRPIAANAFREVLDAAAIPAEVVDASDRNHGEINQWFGRDDDAKVTGKAWEFLSALAAP